MYNLNQKGAIQFIVLAIILLGIIAGVYLITAGPLKLFPRAASNPISGPISAPIISPSTPQPSASSQPSPSASPTPSATPITKTITQFRYAENPADLQTASWQSYSQGMVASYTFKDTSPGTKFIFIQFMDNSGQIAKINGADYISASIELTTPQTNTSTSGNGTSRSGTTIIPQPVQNNTIQQNSTQQKTTVPAQPSTVGKPTGLAGPGWYCDADKGNTSYFYVNADGTEGQTTYCNPGEVCQTITTPGYASDAKCVSGGTSEGGSGSTLGQPTGLPGPGWYCDVDTGNTSYFFVNADGTQGEITQCPSGQVCHTIKTEGYTSDAECVNP